ncbi:unnamed protein product [Coffea canephora]|uniref:Uncharacterized protein n=1 Tax=Coffea canephora TaxID=49390 RepID=A0A068UP01_COFCA|nr:unnamed protein product [Coffea canephora]
MCVCINTHIYIVRLCTLGTIAFNVETVEYMNVNFAFWDIGGQGEFYRLWRHYFKNTQDLVFVIYQSQIVLLWGRKFVP